MRASLIECTMQQGPDIVLTSHPETFFNQEEAKVNSWSHGNQWQDLYVLKFHTFLKGRRHGRFADSLTTQKSLICIKNNSH